METKAVTYARVSSIEQRDSGYSIPAQEKLFQDYAKSKGLHVVKEFKESESAKNSSRRLFKELLEYVKKQKIKAIIFEKVDRMTRNFTDLVAIYDLMENNEIQIHLVKNGLVLDKHSKSQEKFQLDINVVLARNYINNLSEEVKKGMLQKRLQGGWNHKAPFGYRNVKQSGKSAIEVHPEESILVKEIFELGFKGYSVSKIVQKLETKMNLSRASIHNILKNPFYIGYIKYQNETIRAQHEAIIELVFFEAVQKKLSKRNNKITAEKRVFRFSGLLECNCGLKMYGELKKGRYITYGCGSRQFKRLCNSSTKYLSETKVIEQLESYLKQISITETDKKEIDTAIQAMFQQMELESKQLGDKTHLEIGKLKSKIIKLLDYYEDGLLTKEEYLERKDYMNDQLMKARTKYEANIIVPLNIRETFKNLYEPIINLHKYWLKIENINDFQEIMKTIFTNLIMKDGKLDVYPTKLGEILLKRSDDLEWLGWLDSNQRSRDQNPLPCRLATPQNIVG
jgi:site-specific DNA recombinase